MATLVFEAVCIPRAECVIPCRLATQLPEMWVFRMHSLQNWTAHINIMASKVILHRHTIVGKQGPDLGYGRSELSDGITYNSGLVGQHRSSNWQGRGRTWGMAAVSSVMAALPVLASPTAQRSTTASAQAMALSMAASDAGPLLLLLPLLFRLESSAAVTDCLCAGHCSASSSQAPCSACMAGVPAHKPAGIILVRPSANAHPHTGEQQWRYLCRGTTAAVKLLVVLSEGST